jgi:hypothetical protein
VLTVFLCSNPCRTIQIEYFYSIFNLPTAFERFRLILLPILFRHVWSICSKPVSVSIATRFTNSSSHPCIATSLEFLRCYCLHNNISFVSQHQLPGFGLTCNWKIVCFIAKTHAFSNLATEILWLNHFWLRASPDHFVYNLPHQLLLINVYFYTRDDQNPPNLTLLPCLSYFDPDILIP